MVLNGPMDLHHLFKDVMEKSWPQGIQRWTYENDVLMIKLKGNPWYANGEDTVHARVILHTLIGALQVKQWKLYANSNLRSSANTLFFEYDPNIVPGMQFSPMPGMQLSQSYFTVSLNSHDLLRLIGVPEGLVSAVRTTLQTFWSRGIQEERAYATSWQFKLRGNPWWASGDEAVDSRFLVLKILEALQAYGWSVAASIDCSRKDSDKHFKASCVGRDGEQSLRRSLRASSCQLRGVPKLWRASELASVASTRRLHGLKGPVHRRERPLEIERLTSRAAGTDLRSGIQCRLREMFGRKKQLFDDHCR